LYRQAAYLSTTTLLLQQQLGAKEDCRLSMDLLVLTTEKLLRRGRDVEDLLGYRQEDRMSRLRKKKEFIVSKDSQEGCCKSKERNRGRR